jgi:hypothetical protein
MLKSDALFSGLVDRGIKNNTKKRLSSGWIPSVQSLQNSISAFIASSLNRKYTVLLRRLHRNSFPEDKMDGS